jgi:NAD(P)-dependent dehydrogenase (short-subunit alcohol dehydrogenase family)
MTKRILITGGTSGIGLSATKLFIEKGGSGGCRYKSR